MKKFIYQIRWLSLVVVTIAGLASLASCSNPPATQMPALETGAVLSTSLIQVTPAQDEKTPQVESAVVQGSLSPTTSATEKPTASALPTQENPAPTESLVVKTELEATDPGSVQLASGKPQLVEFFAFW